MENTTSSSNKNTEANTESMTSETASAQSSEQAANGRTDSTLHDGETNSSPIEKLQAEVKDHQNRYLYLYAEFETFKKRSIKERSDFLKFGHENFARELLQVSDNLERALEHTSNPDALITGIKMVEQQLKDTLSKFGVQTIVSKGSKFNPEQHEAVAQVQTTSPDLEGAVLQEYQKGYTLHGRLLRPARVSIGIK